MDKNRPNIVHIDPQVDYTTTLPDFFTSAQHSMSAVELKAFIFFIGVVQANTAEEERLDTHKYTLFAKEVADRLQEDYVKKRPRLIFETFRRLQQKTIQFSDTEDELDDEANRKSFALFSTVSFFGREKNKPLVLSLPAELNQYLYEAKKQIPYSFDELNKLSSINSLKIFMYLKTLSAKGIHSVSIDKFKKDLGFQSSSYLNFFELRRSILRPVEDEIRHATIYKDFSISHDGYKRKAAHNLFWHFLEPSLVSSPEQRATLKLLKSDDLEKLSKFSKEKQDAIKRALQAGYNQTYISRLLDYNQDDVVLAANIDLAILQAKKNNLPPESVGKMIWSAVTNNWAQKETNKDYLNRKRSALRAKLTQTELELGLDREVDLEMSYKRKACTIFNNMSAQEKETFYIENKTYIMNVFGQKKSFDLSKYLHIKPNGQPDWRYLEVRAVRDVLVGQLKNGDLDEKDANAPSLWA